jgi:hypothetical protein
MEEVAPGGGGGSRAGQDEAGEQQTVPVRGWAASGARGPG